MPDPADSGPDPGKTRIEDGTVLRAGRSDTRPAGRPDPAGLSPIPGEMVPESALRGRPFGRYLLLEELGRGGMGVVWAALDQQLGRRVALKQILVQGAAGGDIVQRFMREARLAAKLRHPNIVAVHDVGVHDGQHYFTTDYIDASPLADRLAERPAPRQAVAWIRGVAEALAYAHEQGVVHRDVKPANILIDRKGQPFVMDFGLAKEVDLAAGASDGRSPLTMTGALLGTPLYMSPEQAGGQHDRVGPASDQFALGVVLYEALCGRPPFQGQALRDLLNAVAEREPARPRSLVPGLDRDLETVCLKALEKDPTRRYASMVEFAADLGRVLEGEPIAARPIGAGARWLRRVGRNPRVAVALALAGLFVVALSASALVTQARRQRDIGEAMAVGLRSRGEDRPGEARDAFQKVLALDAAHAEARAGYEWADGEVRRRAALEQEERRTALAGEARARETLRKAALVSKVLARWRPLFEPLRALERTRFDSSLSEEERRGANAGPWAAVEAFVAQTPDDATSQATMRALAGWARVHAGHPEEGLAWMRQAAELDPDVPYGALMEALGTFGVVVDRQPLPEILSGSTGVQFGPPPGEPPDVAKARQRVETLLVAVARAEVWGREGAADFALAVAGIRAFQGGEYGVAVERFTAALASEDLRAFEIGFVLARSRARYLVLDFAGALADLERATAVRPGQAEVHQFRGVVLAGRAYVVAAQGEDIRPLLRDAQAACDEAIRLDPGVAWAYQQRGSNGRAIAHAALVLGEDPSDPCERAIADFTRALELDPQLNLARVDRASVRLILAQAHAVRGLPGEADVEAAIADCDEALRQGTETALAHAQRGAAQMTQGDLETAQGVDPRDSLHRALADWEEARRLDSGFPNAHYNLALVHLRIAVAESRRGRDPRDRLREALSAFDEALRRDPEMVSARAERGEAHLNAGLEAAERGADPRESFAAALADCDAVIARLPRDSRARQVRGQAHRATGEAAEARGEDPRPSYDRALADFAVALEPRPTDPGLLADRATLHRLHGEATLRRDGNPVPSYQQALADLDQAAKVNPRSATVILARADVGVSLAEAEEARGADPRPTLAAAIADYDRALALDPSAPATHRRRANAMHLMGIGEQAQGVDPRTTFRRALEGYGASLELDPGSATSWQARGIAYQSLGEAEEALGIDPRGSLERAVADYAAALDRNPTMWIARMNRGIVFAGWNEPEKAIAEYEAALALRPDQPYPRQLLARARAAVADSRRPAWAELVRAGVRALQAGDVARARTVCEEAVSAAGDPADLDPALHALLVDAHYILARVFALRSSEGRGSAPDESAACRDRAFEHLSRAIDLGWSDATHLRQNPDLASLRGEPRWEDLMLRLPGPRDGK